MAKLSQKLKFYSFQIEIVMIKQAICTGYGLAFDPKFTTIVMGLIFMAEIALNTLIVKKVPYTEIDWKAYMSEVEGYLNGSTNYYDLKGDTGPLVYPGGFVYIGVLN